MYSKRVNSLLSIALSVLEMNAVFTPFCVLEYTCNCAVPMLGAEVEVLPTDDRVVSARPRLPGHLQTLPGHLHHTLCPGRRAPVARCETLSLPTMV